MADNPIERIGYFNLTESFDQPFEALRKALAVAKEMRNSLIVLPEAFNYGRNYAEALCDNTDKAPRFSKTETLKELSGIAADGLVAFVVGVLDAESGRKRSSAYLVRGNNRKPVLLHHKQTPDSSGTYDPVPAEGQPADNPFDYRNVRIGVLICNELVCYTERTLKGNLRTALDTNTNLPRVICIPACMTSDMANGATLDRAWAEGKYVVLANSKPGGCQSFIANKRTDKQWPNGWAPPAAPNQVVLKTWKELDA